MCRTQPTVVNGPVGHTLAKPIMQLVDLVFSGIKHRHRHEYESAEKPVVLLRGRNSCFPCVTSRLSGITVRRRSGEPAMKERIDDQHPRPGQISVGSCANY